MLQRLFIGFDKRQVFCNLLFDGDSGFGQSCPRGRQTLLQERLKFDGFARAQDFPRFRSAITQDLLDKGRKLFGTTSEANERDNGRNQEQQQTRSKKKISPPCACHDTFKRARRMIRTQRPRSMPRERRRWLLLRLELTR